jgi:hypothetical protein
MNNLKILFFRARRAVVRMQRPGLWGSWSLAVIAYDFMREGADVYKVPVA